MTEPTAQSETTETPANATEPTAATPEPVAASTATEPEVEKPAEAKAEEKPEERVKAKQFAYLQKQERKLNEQREALKAAVETERGQLESAREELRSVYQRIQQEKSELDEVKNSYEKLIGAAKTNPVEWLREHAGITPEEYFARIQGDGKPSPEFMLKSETERISKTLDEKLTPLQKELEEHRAFRKQLEDQRKAWEEHQQEQRKLAEERAEQEHRSAQAGEAQKQFLDLLDSDKGAYADLLIYDREDVLTFAGQLVRELGDKAASLSIRDIADELQRSVAEQHAKIRGGQVQKAADVKAGEPDKKSEPQPADDDPVAQAAAARLSKMKSVPKGQVRTAQTLNGDMSGRSTVTTTPNDRESRVKRVIADLDARP